MKWPWISRKEHDLDLRLLESKIDGLADVRERIGGLTSELHKLAASVWEKLRDRTKDEPIVDVAAFTTIEDKRSALRGLASRIAALERQRDMLRDALGLSRLK